MSDLHCAARFLLVGAAPSGAVAERLAAARVAASYDAPVDLDALADLHRGETVLVVGKHDLGTDARVVWLVEVDADGRRISRWDAGHDEVRQT